VRWTKDKKRRVGATIYHATVNDPLDFTTGTQPGTTNPRGVQDLLNNAEVSYSKITWRGGFEFDATPTTLVYGTVATGYKAGGFNDGLPGRHGQLQRQRGDHARSALLPARNAHVVRSRVQGAHRRQCPAPQRQRVPL
jgi:outer membrane receptor protein involved in Fe transport